MPRPDVTPPPARRTPRARFPAALLCCLLACVAAAAGARAQQPFYTDDADVTARGQFHFETINEFGVLHGAARPALRQNSTNFTLAYGLFEHAEVSVSAPLVRVFNERGTNPRAPAGFGDASFQLKYNFLRERAGSRRPALALTFAFEAPTGSVAKGIGSGLADYSVNAVAQKSLTDKTTLRLNGGVVFAGNAAAGAAGAPVRGRVLTAGGSLVRGFGERLALGAEVTGAHSPDSDLGRTLLQTQVGGNYTLGPRVTLDFGVLAGRHIASPRVGARLGLSVDLKTRR